MLIIIIITRQEKNMPSLLVLRVASDLRHLYCLQETDFIDTLRCVIQRAQPLLDVVKKDNLPIQVLPLDVTNETSVKGTIERIVRKGRSSTREDYNGRQVRITEK